MEDEVCCGALMREVDVTVDTIGMLTCDRCRRRVWLVAGRRVQAATALEIARMLDSREAHEHGAADESSPT